MGMTLNSMTSYNPKIHNFRRKSNMISCYNELKVFYMIFQNNMKKNSFKNYKCSKNLINNTLKNDFLSELKSSSYRLSSIQNSPLLISIDSNQLNSNFFAKFPYTLHHK